MKSFKFPSRGIELISNIMNILNIVFGWLVIQNYKTWVGVLIIASGVLAMVLIYYRSKLQAEISTYIYGNSQRYKAERQTAFRDVDEEKQWMFLQLSEKYPGMSCQTLKKLIETHYS